MICSGSMPPLPGALAWFAIKVAMVAAAIVLCFRMVSEPNRPIQPWAEGLVLILSQRPILSDLHHGNISRVASKLSIGRNTLYRKMRRLGIAFPARQSARR